MKRSHSHRVPLGPTLILLHARRLACLSSILVSMGCAQMNLAPERSRAPASRPIASQLMRPSEILPEWLNPFDQSARIAKRLTILERGLESRREREQYFRHQSELRDDMERIEFLSLPSFETRQAWLERRGLDEPTGFRPDVEQLIEQNDIALGMTRRAVRESWGEPELVEVAGNPIYGNERWHFSDQRPTPDGFQTERRIVYFDRGLVVGWERR